MWVPASIFMVKIAALGQAKKLGKNCKNIIACRERTLYYRLSKKIFIS
jgi:hypothetical protein